MKAWWTHLVQRILGLPRGAWAPLYRGRALSRRILPPVLPGVIVVAVLAGVLSYILVRHPHALNFGLLMTWNALATARGL